MQCRYPIDCPVWVFSRDRNDASKSSTFKRGKVASLSMDFISKKLMYDVEIDGGEDVTVAEGNLGYASSCLVTVTSKEEGGEMQNGTVLMCKKNDVGLFYTVGYDGRFEDNVLPQRVKYRKVEDTPGEVASVRSQSRPESEEVATDKVSERYHQMQSLKPNETAEKAVVPTSITCEVERSATSSSVSTCSNKKQKTGPESSLLVNKISTQTTNQGFQLRIVVPMWMQQDYRTQYFLFRK